MSIEKTEYQDLFNELVALIENTKKLSKNYPFILLGVLFWLSCVEFSLNSGAIRVKFAWTNQKIRTNNSKK